MAGCVLSHTGWCAGSRQLEVVMGAEADNQRILATLQSGKDDVFLLSQSTLDAERGFCTYPMRRQELLQAVKGAPFRLIPRCVITQSSGKQRIIDNADQGGQSELSADANKLVLCTPLRPAQHIRAVVAQMTPDSLRAAAAADSWESGGEDWPDAYRHSPMSPQECFWHHLWAEPAYQLYAGLLFGLPWRSPDSTGIRGWWSPLDAGWFLCWCQCILTTRA